MNKDFEKLHNLLILLDFDYSYQNPNPNSYAYTHVYKCKKSKIILFYREGDKDIRFIKVVMVSITMTIQESIDYIKTRYKKDIRDIKISKLLNG